MPKTNLLIAIATSTLLFAPGCSENMSNKEKGELAGYVLGAAVGIAIGDDLGIGESAGAVLGAAAGFVVGGVIGANLDEVDRLKLEVATLSALQIEEETTVRWKSAKNENVSGTVSTKATTVASSNECRVVSHVVNIRGDEYRERDTLCRQSDGSWALS